MTASVKLRSVRDTRVRTKVCHRETTSAVRLLAADTRDTGGKRRITVGIVVRGELLPGSIT